MNILKMKAEDAQKLIDEILDNITKEELVKELQDSGFNVTDADKMLEDLGYINETDEFSIKESKILEYMLPLEDSNFDRYKHITFWNDKTVSVATYEYNIEDELKDIHIDDITPQEIKAIYQKCKELGWL